MIYRIEKKIRLLFFLVTIIIVLFGIYLIIFESGLSIFHRIICYLTILFFGISYYLISKVKFVINNESMECYKTDIKSLMKGIIQERKQFIYWNDIKEMNTYYLLYPELMGFICFKLQSNFGQKEVEIPIGGMPLEMIKDILSHLPHGTTINLYPYLRRKVEGKQTWFYNE